MDHFEYLYIMKPFNSDIDRNPVEINKCCPYAGIYLSILPV